MARLEKAYSSVFGSTTAKGQLYSGFYLLIGGFFALLAAVVVFLIGSNQTGTTVYRWREAAFVLAAIAAPAVFMGFSVALPSKRVMRLVQWIGVALCVLAVILFTAHYPLNFNVPDSTQADYAGLDIGLYVVGASLVLAGLFTSVIGYYLDRVAAASGPRRGEDGSVYDEYDVPDAVVERDIEYAMRKYKYAWGEGEGASTGVQINIKDDFEAGTVVGGKGVARTVQLEAPQVDEATKALRSVRPTKDRSISAEWTEDTTKALMEFRKQKAALPAAKARRASWWDRFLQWLGIRRAPATVSEVPTHSQAPAPRKPNP